MTDPGGPVQIGFDKEKLEKAVEQAFQRVGRAGASAILDAAGRELAKLQNVIGIAKEILKPK